jgi:uncharacterized RDD family membrane protein YckC
VPDAGSLPQFPPDRDTVAPIQNNNYAGWWIRVLAHLLDGLVILVVALVISSLLGLHTPFNVLKFQTVAGQQRLVPIGHKLVGYDIITAVLAFAYAVPFLSSAWQATPFMRLCGIGIRRAHDGSKVDVGRAALRSGVYAGLVLLGAIAPILGLVVVVDLLWPLWDPRNQTLHDKVASTVVVITRPR